MTELFEKLKMKYKHNQQAYEIVSGVKDLESLKKYGLSESEINELKGIKKDGSKEIKKVRVSTPLMITFLE